MFELANPWVLIATPLPFLIWFLLPRASSKISVALMVPFFKSMEPLVNNDSKKINTKNYFIYLFASWIFLLLALAGPRFVGEPTMLSRESYNIMLALDISPSMGINDMRANGRQVTRLSAVKKAAKQFVLDRVGDKFGLILFGEKAYLLTPLTFDRQNVLMRLDDATVGLAGKSTSTGDALGLAIKRLQSLDSKGRMIVLLTDGASNSGILTPMQAAELARNDGIIIYTIGLHSEIDPHSFSGLFLNANASADLDEETLKEVAKMTGGKYFRASNPQSLQKIYQSIDKLTKVKQDEQTIRPQYEYYPWFVVVALSLFLYVIARQAGFRLELSDSLRQDIK